MSTRGSTFKIGSVELPINTKKSNLIPQEFEYVIEGVNKKVAEAVMLGLANKMPVLLIGPTGCGKSALVKFIAAKTKNSYRRIQVNGSTNVENFVGRWLINSEGTYWVDGLLTAAMRQGDILVLDELNAALPEVLFVLHSVMDDDGVLILDEKDGEIVVPHPDFRIVATVNPSDEYAGTKEMNLAFIDRFPIVQRVAYPTSNMEVKIIEAHTGLTADFGKNDLRGVKGITPRMVEYATAVRKLHDDEKIIFPFSTRTLISWAKLARIIGVKKAAHTTFLNKASDDKDAKSLVDELNKLFRNDEDKPQSVLEAQIAQEMQAAQNAVPGSNGAIVDVVKESIDSEDVAF